MGQNRMQPGNISIRWHLFEIRAKLNHQQLPKAKKVMAIVGSKVWICFHCLQKHLRYLKYFTNWRYYFALFRIACHSSDCTNCTNCTRLYFPSKLLQNFEAIHALKNKHYAYWWMFSVCLLMRNFIRVFEFQS